MAKLYPNIMQVLQLLLIIPVTSSGVERANSVLANIKTEARSTMRQDRLNARILLNIHKDIAIDIGMLIDI